MAIRCTRKRDEVFPNHNENKLYREFQRYFNQAWKKYVGSTTSSVLKNFRNSSSGIELRAHSFVQVAGGKGAFAGFESFSIYANGRYGKTESTYR